MSNIIDNKLFHFITFAGGSANYHEAGNRILNQARDSKLFTSSRLFTEIDLSEINQEISLYIDQNPIGFGFWIWKPIVIKYYLDNYVGENEYLVYVDAGCELASNWLSKRRFKKFCESNLQQDVLAFSTQGPEIQWTKSIAIKLLNPEISKLSPQVAATIIVIRKSNSSLQLVNSWLTLCVRKKGELIDGTLSEEDPNFLEHRYDQSLFSIVYKNSGYHLFNMRQPSYSTNPSYVDPLNRLAYSGYFIWPIRNRSGNSLFARTYRNPIRPLFSPCALIIMKVIRISTKYLKIVKFKLSIAGTEIVDK